MKNRGLPLPFFGWQGWMAKPQEDLRGLLNPAHGLCRSWVWQGWWMRKRPSTSACVSCQPPSSNSSARAGQSLGVCRVAARVREAGCLQVASTGHESASNMYKDCDTAQWVVLPINRCKACMYFNLMGIAPLHRNRCRRDPDSCVFRSLAGHRPGTLPCAIPFQL